MNCRWRNQCETPELCCHYCQSKKCNMRCKDLDNNKKCIYLINEKVNKKPNKVVADNEQQVVIRHRGRPKKEKEEQIVTSEPKRRGRPKKNN